MTRWPGLSGTIGLGAGDLLKWGAEEGPGDGMSEGGSSGHCGKLLPVGPHWYQQEDGQPGQPRCGVGYQETGQAGVQ